MKDQKNNTAAISAAGKHIYLIHTYLHKLAKTEQSLHSIQNSFARQTALLHYTHAAILGLASRSLNGSNDTSDTLTFFLGGTLAGLRHVPDKKLSSLPEAAKINPRKHGDGLPGRDLNSG